MLSILKIYITLRKILLNSAYRVNVMGLLYNDRHDILPPIWNLSHYFTGFICVLVFIYNSHIPVHTCTIFSCYQWSNRSLSSILSLNRCLHFSTRMFYRTIVLYMLDSWCKMHNLYSILFTSLGHISFFIYGLLFPKDKIISFYQFHVLYNNFGDMNAVCQQCCFNRYLYVIHLCVFHFSECLCVCVCLCIYCCACMNCMYVFIVGQ